MEQVMKNFIKNVLLFMLISYFVLSILNGINIPSNPIYLLATLLIVSIGMLMTSPILNFLTIRENFITSFLMTFLISFGLLYLLQIFMVDFIIEEYVFNGVQLGSVIISSITMTPLISIGVGAFLASFFSATFSVLERN